MTCSRVKFTYTFNLTCKNKVCTRLALLCSADGVCLNDLHWERRKYNAFDAYSESKLANVLFSVELARRLKGKEFSPFSCA